MKTVTGLFAKPTEISSAQATEKFFSMNWRTGVISNGCARRMLMFASATSASERSSGGSFKRFTSRSGMACSYVFNTTSVSPPSTMLVILI